jgi:hypothetical protein
VCFSHSYQNKKVWYSFLVLVILPFMEFADIALQQQFGANSWKFAKSAVQGSLHACRFVSLRHGVVFDCW